MNEIITVLGIIAGLFIVALLVSIVCFGIGWFIVGPILYRTFGKYLNL